MITANERPQTLADLLRVIDQAVEGLPSLTADTTLQCLWQQRITSGSPALQESDFPLADAANLLIALLSSSLDHTLDFSRAHLLVSAYLQDQPQPALWNELPLTPEQGNLYVHLASQGSLSRIAHHIVPLVSLLHWPENFCPICGSTPNFASLSKDVGERNLVCGACFTTWRYKRIGCVSCGEEDPQRLRVLTPENFPGWLVFACSNCRGYIKTADLRQLVSPPHWQEAELNTLPLDYAVTKWLQDSALTPDQQ